MRNTKETLQTATPYIAKQLWNRNWLTFFTLLFGLPLFFFYGYCWGLWGRGSLLFQYLFQCKCPVASEEARYPDDVDVIVPTCRNFYSILSPSGRLLYVQEKDGSADSAYLLNFQTDEKTPFFVPAGSHYFLTDDLLFLSLGYGEGDKIMDRKMGKQYPIQSFISLRPDAYNPDVNLGILAYYLKAAENVFVIDNDFIVALVSDFRTFPSNNFYFDQSDFPGYESDQGERFLRNNHIVYRYVPGRFSAEAVSPDGRFIARSDGIYLTKTDRKIVEEYFSNKYYRWSRWGFNSVRGWTYDSTGVIYSMSKPPCLFELSLPGFDTPTCDFPLLQPLIKLKVPDEYLR